MPRIKDDKILRGIVPRESFSQILNIYTDEDIDDEFSTKESLSINKAVTFSNVPAIGETNVNYYEYEVTPSDTYHLISYKEYGTIELWWVICKLNKIYDPSKLPTTGDKLNLLKSELLPGLINSLKQ